MTHSEVDARVMKQRAWIQISVPANFFRLLMIHGGVDAQGFTARVRRVLAATRKPGIHLLAKEQARTPNSISRLRSTARRAPV